MPEILIEIQAGATLTESEIFGGTTATCELYAEFRNNFNGPTGFRGKLFRNWDKD